MSATRDLSVWRTGIVMDYLHGFAVGSEYGFRVARTLDP
jgi:hypothetical protein